MPAVAARSSYAGDLATAFGDEVSDALAVGVQRRWFAEIEVAIKTEPSLAAAAFPTLPPRRTAALCRWAATPSASSDAAVAIAVAAAASGPGAAHMAALIVAGHPEIAVHADLIDVLSEQVRAGDSAAAIACCRAGVSPFPLTVLDPTYVSADYLAVQRAWITSLLAAHSPSPAARRRRLHLIQQAAAEAGVVVDHGGGHAMAAPIRASLHRAATAPHFGGMRPDSGPLIWLASMAVQQGAAMRDRRFAARMRTTAAAHAGITGDLRVLAALSGTPTPTPSTAST